MKKSDYVEMVVNFLGDASGSVPIGFCNGSEEYWNGYIKKE